MATIKVRVRETHNYAGAPAGSVLEVEESELRSAWWALERHVEQPETRRSDRKPPTLAEVLRYGAFSQAEAERVVAHEQLDYEHGWGDYRPREIEELEERVDAELEHEDEQLELEAPPAAASEPAPEPVAPPVSEAPAGATTNATNVSELEALLKQREEAAETAAADTAPGKVRKTKAEKAK